MKVQWRMSSWGEVFEMDGKEEGEAEECYDDEVDESD